MNLSARLTSWRPQPGGSGAATRLLEFFRYHGPLAPGVRLLRSLRMKGKALVVATAFLVPVIVMTSAYLASASRELQQLASSQEGLAYVTRVMVLSDAVLVLRRDSALQGVGLATPDASAHLAAVEAALVALDQADATAGGRLGTAGSHRALDQAWARVRASDPATRERPFAERALSETLNRLLQSVVAGSGLGIAENAVSRQAQMATLQTLPHLCDMLAGLRGAGAQMLAGGSDAPTSALARQRAQLAALDLVQLGEAGLPTEAGRLARAQALLQRAAQAVFVDRPHGDPAEFIARADEAIAGAVEVHRAGLDEVATRLAKRRDEIERGRRLVVVAVSLAVVLGLYLLTSFYRVMRGGIRQIHDHVGLMASGDLSARPRAWGNDEVAQALDSLGGSLSRLADLFALVRQGVGAVSHASNEIAVANQDLTRRTDESSERLGQVVQGLSRYNEQLEDCGRRVDEAVGVIEEMRLDAVRSRGNMDRLQERMRLLKGKSGEIGEIVTIIDGLAFRTNILALNASIEAAKAGEAGHGFSVVAQEVRRLAQRSADSAREIGEIIGRSTDDIEQGGALAELAGETLRVTDRHVDRAREAMAAIVGITREGQANTHAMLAEVRELDKLTSGNRDMVEQMARASSALSQEGRALTDRVGSFKLT